MDCYILIFHNDNPADGKDYKTKRHKRSQPHALYYIPSCQHNCACVCPVDKPDAANHKICDSNCNDTNLSGIILVLLQQKEIKINHLMNSLEVKF